MTRAQNTLIALTKNHNFSLERLKKPNEYGLPTAAFQSVHYIRTRVNLKTISKGIPHDKYSLRVQLLGNI